KPQHYAGISTGVLQSHLIDMVVEASKRPRMTAADNITRLRQRREAIVRQHAEAENRHDVEATIATFHHPRYEVNGDPSDGEDAVRKLQQGLMAGFPDLNLDMSRMRMC